MALKTKPRWDKYDGYVGNYRGVLGEDIDLDTEANRVLAVGTNSNGAIVVGAGQTGIKGLMIVAVGADIHGAMLDGGINNHAGDPQDVGKHGEITNFQPTVFGRTFGVAISATEGNVKLAVNGVDTGNIAYNTSAANLKSGIVAVDDGFTADDFTVTGTAPNFTVVTTRTDVTITASGDGVTVTEATAVAAAGTNYYGHADGTVNAVKGSDGVYVGHTQEADRLIVNVKDEED
ncbi:minor capsid protein [Mycobacterium phage Madruga]|uniref:Uncharacterized protein n=1 Tax=Mycobacterium phage Madruga TaxID=1675552 RepID=A0A0K1LT43_9CAUD|nr:minor capsid protein [Mycobacterium phage Madruga]